VSCSCVYLLGPGVGALMESSDWFVESTIQLPMGVVKDAVLDEVHRGLKL
jgi:hypothetical protein